MMEIANIRWHPFKIIQHNSSPLTSKQRAPSRHYNRRHEDIPEERVLLTTWRDCLRDVVLRSEIWRENGVLMLALAHRVASFATAAF
jgi:hypothetical protein